MNYKGPGMYEHYKGGLYHVWGVAQNEHDGSKMVIYTSCSSDHELDRAARGVDFVARALSEDDGEDYFNDLVFIAGEKNLHGVPRFRKIHA